MPDVEEKVRALGIDFWPIGESDHPRGSLPRSLAQLGRLKGLSALRFTIGAVARTSVMVCRDAPAAVRSAGIQVLLVDQIGPAGGAVADYLRIPFITVCNALALNRDPLYRRPSHHGNTPMTAGQSCATGSATGCRTGSCVPWADAVGEYREKWKLPAVRSTDESFSKLAQICQMPRIRFSACATPGVFPYVGPLRRSLPAPAPFPWDRLDGRPLVCASLGTLQNSREDVFRLFAEACYGLNVQLVLNHVGGLSASFTNLPGDPVVVGSAPQVELLARARFTITHAGMNTVLDSLIHGVPLVAIPITYEQPAIAQRVEWTGCGRSVSLAKLSAPLLREVLSDVLDGEKYHTASRRIGDSICKAGGVRRAADLIEAAVPS
jgi:zeaxanthin glucosyltransferase